MKKKIEFRLTSHVMLLTSCFIVLSGHLCELKAQTSRNCSEIHLLNPAAPSGVYMIDPDGNGPMPSMNCQCDMTTDGGGWTLVLNYNHLDNTDPALKVCTENLPLQGQIALGFDESNTIYWGHAGTTVMTAIPFDEVRFYGITSDHTRVIDFKTSHAGTISYFKTGIGSTEGISSNFIPLAAHSAYLPAAINMTVTNQGDYAMTAYPLWTGSTYHWYLGGTDPSCIRRWEVDDYPCTTPSTFHQIWVKQNVFSGMKTDHKAKIEIKLTPNPLDQNAELTISNITPEQFSHTQVSVYNLAGEQVSPIITRNAGSFSIGRESLAPGIYICKLVNETVILAITKMVIK